MFTILERMKNHEDTGAWITCIWMAACVIMPLVTIIWSFGSSYSWFFEVMCIMIWAGLFWWTGESLPVQEAALYGNENTDLNGNEITREDIFHEATPKYGARAVKKIVAKISYFWDLARIIKNKRS